MHIDEKIFTSSGSDEESEALYNVFYDQYVKATGNSWDKTKFLEKIKKWTFVGDIKGYLAFKKQPSGYNKFVAMAGDPKEKIKAFSEIDAMNIPLWTMTSDTVRKSLEKRGYITISKDLVGLILPKLERKYEHLQANDDGSVIVHDNQLGNVKKFLMMNQPAIEKFNKENNMRINENKSDYLFYKRYYSYLY